MSEDTGSQQSGYKRKAVVGLAVAGAVAGGVAAATMTASAATNPTPGPTAGYGEGFGGPPPGRPHGQAASAAVTKSLTAKALAKYPGGSVKRVEVNSDGSYEVFMTKSDGTRIALKYDKNQAFVSEQTAPARGGMGPGGCTSHTLPNGERPTGAGPGFGPGRPGGGRPGGPPPAAAPSNPESSTGTT